MIIKPLNTIIQNVKNIFKSNAPESNPENNNTIEGVTSTTLGNIFYGEQYSKQRLENDLYIATAQGKALDKIGSDRINSLVRLQPSPAVGFVIFQGTVNTIVPNTATFALNDFTYSTTGGTVQNYNNLPVSQCYYSSSQNLVYVLTASNHNLASGMVITTSGFTPSEYNASNVSITCVDSRTFTYTPTNTPLITPPSTIGVYSHTSAILYITCAQNGLSTNANDGDILTINAEISGLNLTGFVNFDGLRGGSDLETDEDYRLRLLDARQGYLGVFSEDDIITRAKEISGTTKIKVLELTPQVGYCTILFIRGNDTNPIPSSAQVLQMKEHLVPPTRQPTIPASHIIVGVPSVQYLTLEISGLLPNTIAMQNAIKSSILNLVNKLDIGESLSLAKIINTLNGVSDASGNFIVDYTLDAPSANINIDPDEIILCSTDIVIFS